MRSSAPTIVIMAYLWVPFGGRRLMTILVIYRAWPSQVGPSPARSMMD